MIQKVELCLHNDSLFLFGEAFCQLFLTVILVRRLTKVDLGDLSSFTRDELPDLFKQKNDLS